MACLRNSQCKLKILHLPSAGYVKWYETHGIYTIYPIDSFAYSYARWVDRTLVKGDGNYIPYAEWVIMNIVWSEKRKSRNSLHKTIREHFHPVYD